MGGCKCVFQDVVKKQLEKARKSFVGAHHDMCGRKFEQKSFFPHFFHFLPEGRHSICSRYWMTCDLK